MPFFLIPVDGSPPIALDKAIMLMGRQPDCDIVMTNSRKVSRRHCCLAQINGELVVRDMGSMNGVRVNGEVVRREGRLRIGDELHVGDVGYRIAVLDAASKKSAIGGEAPAAPPAQPAKSRPKKPAAPSRPLATPDPKYMSLDIPVLMPEQPEEFSVEETQPRLKKVKKNTGRGSTSKKDDVIELGDSDILDD